MHIIELHGRALDVATAVVERVTAADLARPTPCAGWDLQALLAHCVGQNHGFAAAVEAAARGGTAGVDAYAPQLPGPGAWAESARRVGAAFAAADPAVAVTLAELGVTVPVTVAAGFHLLDTVVHTWDIATALGAAFRPDGALLDAVAAIAQRVPAGPARERPGAAFGPVGAGADDPDPWTATLALLGRAAAIAAG